MAAVGGGPVTGEPASGGPVTGLVAGTEPASGPSSTATLAPASWIGSNDAAGFRAATDGTPGSTYYGAYLIVGEDDYVWWSHEDEQGVAQGHDPGLDVAELEGLTGHEVELIAGNRTAAQVATATAGVVNAIDGVSCSADGSTITVVGTETLSTGTAFASRGAAGYFGSAAERRTGTAADGGTWYSGGLNGNTYASAFTTSAGAKRLVAVDVRLGTTVSAAMRPRVSIYAGGVSDTDATGATIVADLGQLRADLIVANTWARLWVPPDVAAALAGSTRHFLAIKASTTATHLSFENPGSVPSYQGDFATVLIRGDGSMSGDETAAFPATWAGGSENEGSFPFIARVIYDEAPYRGDGSFARVWGVHVDAVSLVSETDLDSMVGMGAALPAITGVVATRMEVAVATHPVGEQFRLGLAQGGDNSTPATPDPDGAAVLAEGPTTGTDTGWIGVDFDPPVALTSEALAWLLFRSDNATAGITVAFAAAPDWDAADPLDNPMDFVRPTISTGDPADGPEVEWFPSGGAGDEHVLDPAEPYEASLVWPGVVMTTARPGNVPGVRLYLSTPGIAIG